MTFRPEPNQELEIGDTTYRIAEHPAAPGMPYGQEGRAAVVYQLVANDKRRALKVFKPRFRIPALVALAGRLAAFADLPGLSVCLRTVLTPQQHAALLRKYPDLIYSMLMPWIDGPTWMETLLDKRELTPEQSLSLARSLVEILSGMESRGLAHCDLSGPNLLLPALAASPNFAAQFPVELVDVEQVYGLGLGKPDVLPGGSQGYAHRKAPAGLWEPEADRFAGAILISEMLGWCDPRVRGAAWGENYFDPAEMQQPCERFNLISDVLKERWGRPVAQLLEQAWSSATLFECAPFQKWLTALQDVELSRHGAQTAPVAQPVAMGTAGAGQPGSADPSGAGAMLAALISAAQAAEAEGNAAEALATYREARSLAPEGSAEARQIQGRIQDIERRRAAEQPTLAVPVVTPQPAPSPANLGGQQTGPGATTPVTQATQSNPPLPVPGPVPANQGAAPPQGSSGPANMPPNRQGFAAPAFVPPVTQLDFMFDDAMMSFQRGDLPRADWLLREILRQQPAFARNGYLASRVLMDVEARMQPAAAAAPPQSITQQRGSMQPVPAPVPVPVPAPGPGPATATATVGAVGRGPVPPVANVNTTGTAVAPRPRRSMVWIVPVILLAILLLAGGAFVASRTFLAGPNPAPTPTLPIAIPVLTETPTALASSFSPTPDATGTAEALLAAQATDTPQPEVTDTQAPTNTEEPTAAPVPTDTPAPTDTPLPTEAPPPAPTDTPVPPPPPTNTPVPPPPPPTHTHTPVPPPPTHTRPPQPTRTPVPTNTPRPAPTNTRPRPTNTPKPAVQPFAVTGAALSVQPQNSTSCPTFFQFTASITTNGQGTITYHWERSDGASTPPDNLYFEGAGTKLATSSWEISASYRGWERLVVTAPNSISSNDATFVLTCK